MKYTETIMYKEICSQPKVLEGIEKENAETLTAIAKQFKAKGITSIVTAARGSSNNACTYFKYLTEIYCSVPVASAAPSVYTLYNGSLNLKGTLVIGVSQSGKAADALEVMSRAKANGAMTVAVTNDKTSPMALAAEHHLYLNAGKELSVAATKTFTAQFYILALIAKYISKNKAIETALEKVPANIEKIISGANGFTDTAEKLRDEKEAFILGRGFNYAAALESCLKMQETTYTRARAYAASDFHHGPFAMVDNTSVMFLLMPTDESFKDMKEMFDKCTAQNAKTVVYTDSDIKGSLSTINLPKGGAIDSPFYNTVATQLLVNSLSVLRGLNPDAPRGLNKVTITK